MHVGLISEQVIAGFGSSEQREAMQLLRRRGTAAAAGTRVIPAGDETVNVFLEVHLTSDRAIS